MVGAELISFEMFEREPTREKRQHRDDVQEEPGKISKFNLCVSGVKVVKIYTENYLIAVLYQIYHF